MSYASSLKSAAVKTSLPPNPWFLTPLSATIALSLAALVPFTLGIPAIAQQSTINSSPQLKSNQSNPVLAVNPVKGNDDLADGSDRAPYKTITRALQAAQPNTIIQLAPGTYSEETGERFPLQLKAGITVQGDAQNRGLEIVIKGSGFFLSPTTARQSVTIVAANKSSLIGVTVINPYAQGYGLWIESSSPTVTDNTFSSSGHDGISVVGNSAPLIRNNYFSQNGANGITVYGTSRPEIRENIFEQNGFAININQSAAPLIVGNRITRNKDGVVIQAKARPILRNNSIEGNDRDGLVAIAQSQPDLGKKGEPGGNFIRNNGQFDIHTQTSQPVLAFGNELTKTQGEINLTGEELTETPVAAVEVAAAESSTSATPSDPSAMPAIAVRGDAGNGAGRSASTPQNIASIPFGERLSEPAPAAQSSVPGMPVTPPASPPATTSAESFPMPGSQPVQPLANSTPVVVEPFPVPAALSGRAETQPRRQMQIIRIATPSLDGETVRSTPAQNGEVSAESFPMPGLAPSTTSVPSSSLPVSTPKVVQTQAQMPKPVPAPVTPKVNSAPIPVPVVARSSAPTSVSPKPVPVSTTVVPTVSAPPAIATSTETESPRSLTFTKPLPPYPSLLRKPAIEPTPAAKEVAITTTPVAVDRPIPQPTVKASPNSLAIPVPAPEARPTTSPVVVRTSPPPQITVSSNTNLLPVPGPNVPIGNTGGRSSTNIFASAAPGDSSSPPAPPNLNGLLGVRYRVLVEAEDDTQQAQVRTLVPGAFSTSYKGRKALQVGAFGDRDKADQLVQALTGQGLKATMEAME